MTRYASSDASAGADVKRAVNLVTKLRDPDVGVTRDLARDVATTLQGDVARSNTASEAAFLNRVAKTKDRIVLNADIKDLGIDVARGNLRALQEIADGRNIETLSRGASDEIIEMKRIIVRATTTFFQQQLMPQARHEIAVQKRQDLAADLTGEEAPIILLGGDEITLSIPHAIESLGLLPSVVTFLQTRARSRIAVTRTGNIDGARGHERAMNAAETAHKVLKSYEETARELELRS